MRIHEDDERDAAEESIDDFPPLPTPHRCGLFCERLLGTMVVGMIIAFCIFCSMILTMERSSLVAQFCWNLTLAEAFVATMLLFSLQYRSVGVVRRSASRSLPLPPLLADRLRAQRSAGRSAKGAWTYALGGLGNQYDESRGSVYCVRCLVWRSKDGHHCNECQRCVEAFDHRE